MTDRYMLEKRVEQYLAVKVKQHGGRAYKFVSPGCAGVPDRIVLLPGGCITFVELKRPGGKLRPIQKACMRYLYHLGFHVSMIDNFKSADGLIRCMITRRK